jgi:hypothetical protein
MYNDETTKIIRRKPPGMEAILWVVFFALLLIWLCGCTSDRQKQAAADVVAGAEAVRPEAKAAGLERVVDGIQANAAVAVDTPRRELPAPTAHPSQIRSNPEYYATSAETAEGDLVGAIGWAAIATTAAAAIAMGLRITGAGGPLGAMLAGVLENATVKQEKLDRRDEREAGATVVQTIARLPEDATIDELKTELGKSMPEPQRLAVRRLRGTTSTPARR